jgi:hypothetical protein
VEGVMRDMQIHLDTLRNEAAECATQSAATNDKQRRDRLVIVCQHLNSLADQIEHAIAADDAY